MFCHHSCFTYNGAISIYNDTHLGLINDLGNVGRAMRLAHLLSSYNSAQGSHGGGMWLWKKIKLGVSDR